MDDDINVPLLAGLLSALGTLLLGLLCIVIWFAIAGDGRIQLGSGDPGSFDDEGALLEEEADALELMDEASRRMYLQAKAFIEANPPNSTNTDISLSQFMTIQEKGVAAWEFEVDFTAANCFVEARTEIEFFDSVCCVQTNLPLPKQNEVYYWEAKIYDKPVSTTVSIGLTTKPYPTFRLPGYHRYSVAYDSEGLKRINQPFSAPHYGPPLQHGDVVGVGYKPRTGTVFFTRNGKKLEEALHGMRMNLFPTVGATGPATVVVNLGQAGFVYIEANVKKWGLAPAHGSLAPPPPYGAEQDYVLLETGIRSGSSRRRDREHDHDNDDDSSDQNYDSIAGSAGSAGFTGKRRQRRRSQRYLNESSAPNSAGSNDLISDDGHDTNHGEDDNEATPLLPPPSFEDVTSQQASPGPDSTSSPAVRTESLRTPAINSNSTASVPSSSSSFISTTSEDQTQFPTLNNSNTTNNHISNRTYTHNNNASINLTRLSHHSLSGSPSTTIASSTPLASTPVVPMGPPMGRPPSYTSDNESDDEQDGDDSLQSRPRRMSTRESIMEATADYINPISSP
ncbi:Ear1p [Sugiyamaella lignohabitans]|uniref:Ear1p n=1 Tax=Sugiyamaella lignohabitans TaxID=796027 RepID=A0A167DKK5_9ASCO|nr:Ear1p [Sugiyamaella lignohabitans]ANB13014.1 Ear1p [Sugiyamaella lignohabitans]